MADRTASASASPPGSAAIGGRFIAALVVVLVPFLALVWRLDFLCDDAFISFRYGKNMALGHGLRFNLGEHQPVEGYSNFLWVLWIAIVERLGLDVTAWARIASIACGAVLIAWWMRFVRDRFDLGVTGIVASGLFLGTLPGIVVWSTGGLAAMPFTLALFGAFERLLGDHERPRGLQAGAFCACAGLLRADGFLWAGAIVAVALVAGYATRRREPRRSAIVAGTVLVAIVAAHIVWRLGYYGDWLPNTARVKGGLTAFRLERGVRYVVSFLMSTPTLVLLAPLALCLVSRAQRVLVRAALALAVVHLCYVIQVGGDFLPFWRFACPTIPFLALSFPAVLARFRGRIAARCAPVLAAVCIAVALLPSYGVEIAPKRVRRALGFRYNFLDAQGEYLAWRSIKRTAESWVVQGKALGLHTRAGESLVCGGVGAVGYYSDLFIYDRFGLVSRDVAARGHPPKEAQAGHDMGVAASFFFKDRPTYLYPRIIERGVSVEEALTPRLARNPWRRLTRTERMPLRVEDGFPPDRDLILLRMLRWSFEEDVFVQLMNAVRGVPLDDPRQAEEVLRERLDPGGPVGREITAELRRLVDEGQIAWRDDGAWRRGRVPDIQRPRSDYRVDAILVEGGDGPSLLHRRGLVAYCAALSGEPTVDGRAPGWMVRSPQEEGHVPRVEGGSMLIVMLRTRP